MKTTPLPGHLDFWVIPEPSLLGWGSVSLLREVFLLELEEISWFWALDWESEDWGVEMGR